MTELCKSHFALYIYIRYITPAIALLGCPVSYNIQGTFTLFHFLFIVYIYMCEQCSYLPLGGPFGNPKRVLKIPLLPFPVNGHIKGQLLVIIVCVHCYRR